MVKVKLIEELAFFVTTMSRLRCLSLPLTWYRSQEPSIRANNTVHKAIKLGLRMGLLLVSVLRWIIV